MPTRETATQRAARRTRRILQRTGEELRIARRSGGLSLRRVGALSGISHTQVRRIELGAAPHVDLGVLVRVASMVGCDLSVTVHPASSPIRDAAHVALLDRLRARLHPSIRWRTEVPIPIPGDLRAADATIEAPDLDAMIEAETRLDDVQALGRRTRAKQRDLGAGRVILLVASTRHNRRVVREVTDLREQFPVGTRACLRALERGVDPGGDCLILL